MLAHHIEGATGSNGQELSTFITDNSCACLWADFVQQGQGVRQQLPFPLHKRHLRVVHQPHLEQVKQEWF